MTPWFVEDRQVVRSIWADWDSELASVAHPRRPFREPKQTKAGDPAVFLAWQMGGYDHVGPGQYGSGGNPQRTGYVIVNFWLQPDRGGAVLDGREGQPGLYEAVTDLFASADTKLTFFEPIPLPDEERPGTNGTWWVEGLRIPFKV